MINNTLEDNGGGGVNKCGYGRWDSLRVSPLKKPRDLARDMLGRFLLGGMASHMLPTNGTNLLLPISQSLTRAAPINVQNNEKVRESFD